MGSLAPLAIGLFLLCALPLLGNVVLSLLSYDALSAPRWAGLAHYRQLLDDPLFRTALQNSVLLALLSVPVRLALALLAALLLQPGGRVSRLGLMAVLMPTVLPPLVLATVGLWLFNPHFGPVAAGLNAWQPFGARELLTATGARATLVVMLGLMIGEMTLILLLARRLIPRWQYELAAVEGLGRWRSFTQVSLPPLLPVIGVLGLRDFALVLQDSFLPAMIVTKGGPQFATYPLPQYIYENGFEYLRFGYAASMSSLVSLMLVLVFLAQIALLGRLRSRTWSPQ